MHFAHAHSLVYQMGTHETQQKLNEVASKALEYMFSMRPLLLGSHCNHHFILHMDQKLVYFSIDAKRTLEVVGVKTIHILTLTRDMKRATVTVAPVSCGLQGTARRSHPED